MALMLGCCSGMLTLVEMQEYLVSFIFSTATKKIMDGNEGEGRVPPSISSARMAMSSFFKRFDVRYFSFLPSLICLDCTDLYA